jgi:BlaI family transcriptional regulator, penicillinase repressor
MEDSPPISDAELAVLKVLWHQGAGNVREIQSQLKGRKRRWAYNTVLTLLSRLREKGYVSSEKSGQAHVFKPAVSRDALLSQRLTQLADQVCDGSASPLVHALVKGQRLSAEEINYFREMLDRLESQE